MSGQLRLGINIDHVATLRQARGENYPSVVEAARKVLSAGADQITIHLREDRRHIQDTDVAPIQLVTKEFGKPLNFEMGCHDEIIDIAISTKPEWICLVPEKREEKTTEGGLDLLDNRNFERVLTTMDKLRKGIPGVKISLFLEASEEILNRAVELKPNAVEIHTGDYARAFQDGDDLKPHFEKFHQAKSLLDHYQIGCHAGHGLTMESTVALLKKELFVEYNIGHWVICRAIFEGLEKVVTDLKTEFMSY